MQLTKLQDTPNEPPALRKGCLHSDEEFKGPQMRLIPALNACSAVWLSSNQALRKELPSVHA